MRFLPLLIFLLGFPLALTALLMLDAPGGVAAGRAFVFVLGLFSYLALMGFLGRVVAVEGKKDLGMFLSFILGPIGVVVAALLRNEP